MSQNPITYWATPERDGGIHLTIGRLWIATTGKLRTRPRIPDFEKLVALVLIEQTGPDPELAENIHERWTMCVEEDVFVTTFQLVETGATAILKGRVSRSDEAAETMAVMSRSHDRLILNLGSAPNAYHYERDWQNFCDGLELLFPWGELGL